MFRRTARLVTPVAAFAAGLAYFPSEWRRSKWSPPPAAYTNGEAVRRIEASPLYQKLHSDPAYQMHRSSEAFPIQHRDNYLSQGLLYGPHLFEVDPIVFVNGRTGELTGFYHMGRGLAGADGKIHNGATATILDEGLCTCGFPLLPSKRGVTAQLAIDFKTAAPPDSTVVLTARVVESKGRKVVIAGTLSTLPAPGAAALEIATATCVLVEPRWFKYFRWLDL